MSTESRIALSGWGANNRSVARVVDTDPADVASRVATAGGRGALVRGLGRSYGDAAQNGGGLVVRLDASHADVHLDAAAGTVTAAAGVSLDDVLRVIVPRGHFVPVTPGTRFVTVGGAIASDIHGKNHHVDGTFGAHVRSLDMLLADGTTVTVGPQRDPELFWATVGGMGLTGVILAATFAVIPVESSRMVVDTRRFDHLDDLLAAMDEEDDRYRYSVAWIDPLASGRRLGRSVLTRGDHAPAALVSRRNAATACAYAPSTVATMPSLMPPGGVINRWTVAAFNEAWFRKAPRRRDGDVQSIPAFFHPLDAVGEWNRVYGRRGLIQYQVVLPFGEEEVLRRVLERLAAAGAASFLAVLKRFGASNPAPISFPAPGWTLALDVPASTALIAVLHELDTVVLDVGGRHYLAKDSHTTPESIRRGYPRLAEWQAVRQRVDPAGLWKSDMSRRLRLVEDL